jgi:hypothetical protein
LRAVEPQLRQAAGTLSVILGQRSAIGKRKGIKLNKVESFVQFEKLEKKWDKNIL